MKCVGYIFQNWLYLTLLVWKRNHDCVGSMSREELTWGEARGSLQTHERRGEAGGRQQTTVSKHKGANSYRSSSDGCKMTD
jgi:hypothetical protein